MAGFELMQRAGRAVFRELVQRWPHARRITVCCGRGNNAGDGYVVAGLAHDTGFDVTVCQLGDAAELTGDAGRARDWATARGVRVDAGPPDSLSADVVVDALLGTGLQGELRPPYARTVAAINGCGRPVLAVDIPTGVSADAGAATEPAVRAAVTVTFIGRKLGLFTGAGVSHSGTVVFDDLGVPPAVYRAVAGCPWLHFAELPEACRPSRRDPAVYKHAMGHVVVVGGDHHMGGAPAMAAEAALRTGAGMVSVVTRPSHRPAILARRPEVMVVDAEDESARRTVFGKADVVVLGPGLGRDAWGTSLLGEALDLALPTVLDADGLNGFAAMEHAGRDSLVVTPHAAEAARLLGWSPADVQKDRPAAARALVRRCGGTAVLKGAGSLVAGAGDDGEPRLLGVCAHGNPGMASAGMGDVLSGVIGGYLAQGLAPAAAAMAGTCLHSLAGDRGARALGERSLLATDLLEHLMALLREEDRRLEDAPR